MLPCLAVWATGPGIRRISIAEAAAKVYSKRASAAGHLPQGEERFGLADRRAARPIL